MLDGRDIVRRGNRGATVEHLQGLLDSTSVDGIFGGQTERAVRGFQGQQGLATDGLVGSQTASALEGDNQGTPSTASSTVTSPASSPDRILDAAQTNPTPQAATPAADSPALQAVIDAVLTVVDQGDLDRARDHVPGIVRQCALSGVDNADQVAYILATADHESGFGQERYSRSESLVEDHNPFKQTASGWEARVHTNGKTVRASTEEELEILYWDSAYGHKLDNSPGTTDARDYRGRGYVQLTGRTNYEEMTNHLNEVGFSYQIDGQTWGANGTPIDLLTHPDHVNRVPELAARILVDGSMLGSFTGRGLDQYINEGGSDFTNARRVINGTDRAADIAAIAERYAAVVRPLWGNVLTAT